MDNDKEYNEWLDKMSTLSDEEVSLEIKKRILMADDLDAKSKKLFEDCYDYFLQKMKEGKNVDSDLLKIYLQDIKGYDIQQINIYQIMLLLSFCGFKMTVDK